MKETFCSYGPTRGLYRVHYDNSAGPLCSSGSNGFSARNAQNPKNDAVFCISRLVLDI